MTDPTLEVRDCGPKGRGVFTRTVIPCGTRVLAMQGVLLRTAELTDDLMALQVGEDLWLCSPGTHLDDLINHSCEPNLGFADGSTTLYAIRDLAVDEELSFDYSTSLSEPGWTLECRCGAPTCRGVIHAWGELSPDDRDRLQGIALAYLRAPKEPRTQ